MISLLLQASYSLNSVERFALSLSMMKASCDRNYVSRHILPPSTLSKYLLNISDRFTGHNPVFSSQQIDLYYKYHLSVSSITNFTIRQIVTIPMASASDKYTVSQEKCLPAHVCFKDRQGRIMTLHTSEYLRCHGAATPGLPIICPSRACLTDHSSVCRTLNLTSLLLSTSHPFKITVWCPESEHLVMISNITYLNVPVHCSISHVKLLVPAINTMRPVQTHHRVIMIPFQRFSFNLTFGSSKLNAEMNRHLNKPGIKELLRSKIPPMEPINSEYLPPHVNHGITLGAFTVSSATVLLMSLIILSLCLCKTQFFSSTRCSSLLPWIVKNQLLF